METRLKHSPMKRCILRMTLFMMTVLTFFVLLSACQKEETTDREIPGDKTSEAISLKNSSITIAEIQALIQKIEDLVQSGELDSGIANSMIFKLQNAIKSLEKGNTKAAMNQCQSVINQLADLIANGTVDPLIGADLIDNLQEVTGGWVCGQPIVDPRDGKLYKTVKIGNQCWMAENLNATAYTDGTPIPNIPSLSYYDIKGEFYAYYDDDPANGSVYGALYTVQVLQSGKLCPVGWHMPSYSEWLILADYLGGEAIAGGKMKSSGTIEGGSGLWLYPNAGATNESGWTGLPGGTIVQMMKEKASYVYLGSDGYWFSSDGPDGEYIFSLYYDCEELFYFKLGTLTKFPPHYFSVRCIKD
jgi:uncharacterized protein (TIGR02145 family)